MVDQNTTANPSSPEAVVLAFVQCFNENRIEDAISLLAEDVFYHNIPMEPMNGRDATAAFFARFDLGGTLTCEWLVTAIASKDDVVLTERVDKFYNADGRSAAVPLMGCFRVRDGLIVEWRDYFDLAEFERQFAALA